MPDKLYTKEKQESEEESKKPTQNKQDEPSVPATHKKEKDGELAFLDASASGSKRIDYGTNDTCELLERIPSKLVELKLNEVLTAVKTVDNLCKYERCRAKTNLMGLDCEHCQKRYCFKHGLPEVHGCSEAVKSDERKKFLHPKPAKTVRAERELGQAKKRLNAKLKDMQVQRMQKTGGGKKKIEIDKKKSKESKEKTVCFKATL